MTIAEALDVLNTSGLFHEVGPGQGKYFPNICVDLKNDGEQVIVVFVIPKPSEW